MMRRIAVIILSVCTALCIFSALTFNWAYTEFFTTSRFVNTATLAAQQPQVQSEIAAAMVTPLVEERNIPPLFQPILQNAAQRIVASPSFQTFWSEAVRAIHQPLVEQLTSDDSIVTTSHRVDLRPMLSKVISDIRAKYPRLSLLITDDIPQAEFELLNKENLESARTVVRILTTARWVLIVIALILLSAVIIMSRRQNRPFRLPLMSITAGAAMALITSFFLPSFATSLVDTAYVDSARTVAESVAASLRTQSFIVTLLGIIAIGATSLLHRRSHLVTP